jgi:hypothetical protein
MVIDGHLPPAEAGLPEVGERLALALNQAGMQRMIARALAAFLFTDRESLSGAITMLRTVGLIEQIPAPASRRDHYRMRPDAWATLMTSKNAMIGLMSEIADAGLATVAGTARLRSASAGCATSTPTCSPNSPP